MKQEFYLDDWWPSVWTFDENAAKSVQKRDGTSCGVYTCINALLLSKGLSDLAFVDTVPSVELRSQIYSSLNIGTVRICYPEGLPPDPQ